MRKSLVISVTALAMVILTGLSASAAADLFVTRRGTDDGNDCRTSSAPCRTITWAVSQAASGDSVKVTRGTYREVIAPETLHRNDRFH